MQNTHKYEYCLREISSAFNNRILYNLTTTRLPLKPGTDVLGKFEDKGCKMKSYGRAN